LGAVLQLTHERDVADIQLTQNVCKLYTFECESKQIKFLLNAWTRVLLKNLAVAQLVRKSLEYCKT